MKKRKKPKESISEELKKLDPDEFVERLRQYGKETGVDKEKLPEKLLNYDRYIRRRKQLIAFVSILILVLSLGGVGYFGLGKPLGDLGTEKVIVHRSFFGIDFEVSSTTIRVGDTLTASSLTNLPRIEGYQIKMLPNSKFQFKNCLNSTCVALFSGDFLIDYSSENRLMWTFFAKAPKQKIQILGTQIVYHVESDREFSATLVRGEAYLSGEKLAPNVKYDFSRSKSGVQLSKVKNSTVDLKAFGIIPEKIAQKKLVRTLKRVIVTLRNGLVIEGFLKKETDDSIVLANGKVYTFDTIKSLKRL